MKYILIAVALGVVLLFQNLDYPTVKGIFAPKDEETVRKKADRATNDFLSALRSELKKQGKEPCDTCYTMMEPDDPRIPEDFCISLTGCPEGTNMYGE